MCAVYVVCFKYIVYVCDMHAVYSVYVFHVCCVFMCVMVCVLCVNVCDICMHPCVSYMLSVVCCKC